MNTSALKTTSKDWLPLTTFASEAGWTTAEVAVMGATGKIRQSGLRSFENKRFRLYFVGDLPEESGSPFLLNYLLRQEQRARQAQQDAQAAIDRVVLHRRSEVAA